MKQNFDNDSDFRYGPAGNRSPTAYNVNAVVNSPAGQALNRLQLMPSAQHIRKIRTEATVECHMKNQTADAVCRPLEKPCLFNISADPCEQNNLAEQ